MPIEKEAALPGCGFSLCSNLVYVITCQLSAMFNFFAVLKLLFLMPGLYARQHAK